MIFEPAGRTTGLATRKMQVEGHAIAHRAPPGKGAGCGGVVVSVWLWMGTCVRNSTSPPGEGWASCACPVRAARGLALCPLLGFRGQVDPARAEI